MLDHMPILLAQMEDDTIEGAPDILAVSSKIIVDIFRKYSEVTYVENQSYASG